MRKWLGKILNLQQGTAMVEYALLLALIFAALIAVVFALGQAVLYLFQGFVDNLFPG